MGIWKTAGGTALGLALFVGNMALAQDAAFVIGNENYDSLQDVRSASQVVRSMDAFLDNGFAVIAQEDATTADLQDGFRRLIEASVPADRVLVVLSGRFVHSSQENWLLPIDTLLPQSLNGADENGLALSSIMAILESHPGKAVLLVATDENAGGAVAPYLSRGLGDLEIPQGVTVFLGGPRAISAFAQDILPRPANAQMMQAARRQGLQVFGFAPEDFTFLPAENMASAAPQPGNALDERTAWQAAERLDTIAAYRAYLDAFPQGENADRAKAMIQEIQSDPNREARKAEEALSLTREQRREIQRDLSILGINPRGIDGIFGPGSRNAISTWQGRNGFDANGYLSREQIVRLEAQAERRAAELEAEAEARRLEQEALDRAFWQETGAAGDEAGLRIYLKRYPDGLFAEVAQDRLDAIETAKLQAAEARDRDAWRTAAAADDLASYQNYLAQFPNGAFADEAKSKIEELSENSEKQALIAAAKRTEDQLQLSKPTRTLIERRLAQLDLKPGKVDGVFDDNTRRAIRRFQRSRNMTVTGYLDQDTVVRLLAGIVLR